MIKRVLCLISGMNMGGAETFLMKIYRQLDKSQYQMDFCVNVFDKCVYDDEILALGGKIFRIPSKSENAREFKRQLTGIIKDNKYDYVLRITSNAAGFWDLKIAKKAGALRTIARSSNTSDGDGIKKAIIHRISRFLWLKYVDVKIAPSDLAAIYTFGKKQYKQGKVSLLHNGIDLNIYHYGVNGRNQIREEFNIKSSTVLLGHVGRFSKQKNHSFLIDIFCEYEKKNKDSKLLLVGIGPLEDSIKEKVHQLNLEEKVLFVGLRRDIPQILSAMDVFVFPSFYEGMPNTVIEAQSTGLPCIIADTITKEADITGLVRYLPLSISPDKWVEEINKVANEPRKDTNQDFINNGYDIESVKNSFIKMIFG